MTVVDLPQPGGGSRLHTLRDPVGWPRPDRPLVRRVAFAAAHVAPRAWGDNVPGAPADIDWESTLGFRHHLWSYGLGVAEAMDTAQRGMGLDWPATRELVRRSAAEARAVGGRIAAGAGTDHAPSGSLTDVYAVANAYLEQVETVQRYGAQVIVMASRDLAAVASSPDDYRAVYDRVLSAVDGPVILHWLGPMFDPALEGYWGSPDLDKAADVVVGLIEDHAARVDGIKVSLLDAGRERALRARLPADVRLYTGDDFHYDALVRGDETGHSDALLGVFAAIAPAASTALQALDRDDLDDYDSAIGPTVPLARHLFEPPTYHYKTGIAFLAWLSGHQPGFAMVGGLHAGRSLGHLLEAFVLADAAGLLPDPELAAVRVRRLCQVAGVAS